MPIAATYINPTGKDALRRSFYEWLQAQILIATSMTGDVDFRWDFINDADPVVFPRVAVQELQYFSPSADYFDMAVWPQGNHQQGVKNAALFQFEIQTDSRKNPDALQRVYRIRDRIMAALHKAGVMDSVTKSIEVAPIHIKDYRTTPATDTGIIARVPFEQDTAIQESYLPPALTQPNIHTIRLLVRVEWFEMIN